MPVIMLASGKPAGFVGTNYASLPVSAIPIAGETLISRQLATLKEISLGDVTLLSGYGCEQLPTCDIKRDP